MRNLRLRYVKAYRDRHGKPRIYYRRGKLEIPIAGAPGSPEFFAAYAKIHASFEEGKDTSAKPGTFGALVTAYYTAPEFTQLRATTKDEYKRHLEDARELWADIPLAGITKKVVIDWRNSRQDRPTTANKGVETLRTLFTYAIDNELAENNPALKIKPLKVPDSDGWAPWPKSALRAWAEKSEGAPRIAFYLALMTGQRRADVLAMSWNDIENGGIHVRQEKTNRKVWVPIHPLLLDELNQVAAGQETQRAKRLKKGQKAAVGLTIVQKRTGEAYTDDGFGTVWNREQHRLGIHHPFHGLRKNATVALLEMGATPQVVQAITGHATMEMVEHYGRRVDQKKLARQGMKLLTSSCFFEQEENKPEGPTV